uniref:Uncharacterized protein n=1 Tax=Magallana gigas TaxID=29159 RepID=K1QVL9_MAGGI
MSWRQWVFIVTIGLLLVLGLAILISSVTFLHAPNNDVPDRCAGPWKQSLQESSQGELETNPTTSAYVDTLLGDSCSGDDSCPENSVCESGQCSCNPTYIAHSGKCYKVLNLALGKAVFGSSTIPSRKATEGWENAVDGRTKVRDFNLIFHTGFELYPWLSIALGGVGLVKNITLYNRIDNYGRWLHDVETRVGNSSDWSKMSTCGTFVGPSKTGQIHTIECGTLLAGTIVTAKIVKPNYIKDNPSARGGRNSLVLEEVVVEGIFL